MISRVCILIALITLTPLSWAAPASKLIPFWNHSNDKNFSTIDHSRWQTFLDAYLIADDPYDINLMDYGSVSTQDHIALKLYIDDLVSLDPRTFHKAVQKAYWINLYNALTVDLILDNYPLQSITQLGRKFFSFGPWNDTSITVVGKKLSLNDIEHGILRPIFKDERIHYAVNCASVSCPNLSGTAFTARNTEKQLDLAARGYINHPRGVEVLGDTLLLSSIYDWYKDDFGDEASLRNHLIKYAEPELAEQLREPNLIIEYGYNWELNSI